mmetsp:Transcript_21130/g.53705  ORF Transcript_21130/g.53705 Transcript_21130/m.53705 type:complete len:271 (-) Transcript_21130:747-1559(-)
MFIYTALTTLGWCQPALPQGCMALSELLSVVATLHTCSLHLQHARVQALRSAAIQPLLLNGGVHHATAAALPRHREPLQGCRCCCLGSLAHGLVPQVQVHQRLTQLRAVHRRWQHGRARALPRAPRPGRQAALQRGGHQRAALAAREHHGGAAPDSAAVGGAHGRGQRLGREAAEQQLQLRVPHLAASLDVAPLKHARHLRVQQLAWQVTRSAQHQGAGWCRRTQHARHELLRVGLHQAEPTAACGCGRSTRLLPGRLVHIHSKVVDLDP